MTLFSNFGDDYANIPTDRHDFQFCIFNDQLIGLSGLCQFTKLAALFIVNKP